ncbi:MAG: flagellar basal body rod protein FlgF [Gammaproteobacteria bacterium]
MSQLYLSAVANARQIMQAQAVNANNLANASTDGFRAEIAYISDAQNGGQALSSPDLSEGVIRTTGRNLDVAVNGRGWIAVQAPDGTEAYSRRGDLHVDPLGQMVDGLGRQIMGNQGPIAIPPFSNIEIANDGTISIQPLGQPANTMAVLDRIKLVDLPDENTLRGEDGLMRLPDNNIADASAAVQVTSRSLEGSNVNTVGEMVKMIELARRFEGQVKLMRSAQENHAALNKIMGMN